MVTLVNTQEPFLRILNPETGAYAVFQAGKLEIEEDDPNYEVVMAEAARRPSISIHVSATQCPECGEVFTGKVGKAQLGAHRKQIHFDAWLRDKEAAQAASVQKEIKGRAGYVCDVCAPVQEFGTEGDLAEHVRLLHTAPPELDEEGNERGAHRPGEVDRIPAATPSGG